MQKLLLVAILAIAGLHAQAQTMSSKQRKIWNQFVDFLDSKGLKGSKTLDKPSVRSLRLWLEYCSEKQYNIEYKPFVVLVQSNIAAYRSQALADIASGKASFAGTADQFMPGLSIVDGWAGSRTTSYKFPADSFLITSDHNKKVRMRANSVYQLSSAGSQE